MRLIDADTVKDVITELNENGYDISPSDLAFVQNILLRIPTIDAVPVVRCKDCKKRGNYFENINEYACLKRGYLTDVKPPNWFCADGERSEE